MDERTIFLTALETGSPDERTDYLDRACGDNTEMRLRVETLLQSREDAASAPAPAPAPAPIGSTPPSAGPSPRIPLAVEDHRPDASAQSRRLAWMVAVTALLVFVPCLLALITESTGVTNMRALFTPQSGTLIVDVGEPTATVTVSGGFTALTAVGRQNIELRPGDYYVSVAALVEGAYQTHVTTVTIESGQTTVVNVPWASSSEDEPVALEIVDAPSLADIPHQSFTGWGASWSPDGTRIVFQSSPDVGANPDGMLQIVNFESGRTRPLVRHGKDPAWSTRADGPIAYVLHGERREDIWLIEADGQNNRELVEGGFPSWSADGSTLYFHHGPSGTLRAIDVDQSSAPPRTLTECQYLYPVVSPDGTMFVLRERTDLVVVDLETGDPILKYDMSETQGLLAGWSGDSRRIVFGGYGSQVDGPLTLIDIGSGQARHILQQPLTMPRFSPDGARLVADDRIARTIVVLDVTELSNEPAGVREDTNDGARGAPVDSMSDSGTARE